MVRAVPASGTRPNGFVTFGALGGFTLIELLVVISIVTLLISILLPVLAHTREAARHVLCLSQERQLLVGIQNYGMNNEDYFIPWYMADSGGGSFRMWSSKVRAGLEILPTYVPREAESSVNSVYLCPNVFWKTNSAGGPTYPEGHNYYGASAYTDYSLNIYATWIWPTDISNPAWNRPPQRMTKKPHLPFLACGQGRHVSGDNNQAYFHGNRRDDGIASNGTHDSTNMAFSDGSASVVRKDDPLIANAGLPSNNYRDWRP